MKVGARTRQIADLELERALIPWIVVHEDLPDVAGHFNGCTRH